jgi:hypothetical protein
MAQQKEIETPAEGGLRTPYFLSPGEWLIAGLVLAALFVFVPRLWPRLERFQPEPAGRRPVEDYRLPYQLSSDYWLYNRYCRWACSRYDVLVVGDSVVWGHYVSEHNTLSHYLNEIAGGDKFANLGVDGIHPIALEGLLRYYARSISGKTVLLHFNPLWISSQKHDLQTDKEFQFNHPHLVPQFVPRIPCYKASYSERIGAVVQRYVAFLGWTSHLKQAYLGNLDLPRWTLEHPYANPLMEISNFRFQISDLPPIGLAEHVPWDEKTAAKRDFQWVELETSLQWRSFRRSVELLRVRGNTVFVLVGPFNEHMMNNEGIEAYRKIKSQVELWLQQNSMPYFMPPVLPSRLYVDASHPLSEGYATLAKQIFESSRLAGFQNHSFKEKFGRRRAGDG